jgi:ADP-ribose pyrophosphatase YjhB (NUDIX family)
MENKILDLFLFKKRLKFSDIEKSLNERSNKIAYHLKNLLKKKVLCLEEKTYFLSESSEYLIPYLSDKKSTLLAVIIHIGNSKECYLIKRIKRPYFGKLALPGGRILLGESLSQSVSRIMKEKFNINAKITTIHSVSLEHVRKKNKKLHSFMLIFVSAKTKEKLNLTPIDKVKKEIIRSDYNLLKNDLKLITKIKTINSKE